MLPANWGTWFTVPKGQPLRPSALALTLPEALRHGGLRARPTQCPNRPHGVLLSGHCLDGICFRGSIDIILYYRHGCRCVVPFCADTSRFQRLPQASNLAAVTSFRRRQVGTTYGAARHTQCNGLTGLLLQVSWRCCLHVHVGRYPDTRGHAPPTTLGITQSHHWLCC
jgi:hypothetical protein